MNNYGFIRLAAAVPKVELADCKANAGRHLALCKKAAAAKAGIALFPELSLTGATCGDLFRQPLIWKKSEEALSELLSKTAALDTVFIAGLPFFAAGRLYKAAAVFQKGRLLGAACESAPREPFFSPSQEGEIGLSELCGQDIPYGAGLVFKSGGLSFTIGFAGEFFGPLSGLAKRSQTAEVLLLQGALPEKAGSFERFEDLLAAQSFLWKNVLVCAAAGEGESSTDENYSGRAFILEKGRVLKKRARFEGAEELIRADADADFIRLERLGLPKPGVPQTVEFSTLPSFSPEPDVSRTPFVPEDPERRRERCREVFEIQVGGLKRRAERLKTGRLIVGVSGGLDSTLALLVSAAANDRNKQPRKGVLGVTMPCFGTTKRTKGNAEKLMEKLGVSSKEISIKKAVEQHFRDIGQKSGVFDSAFENAQARERTQVLMDVANQTNGLVVGTGDLSEAALGWATFGGDHLSMYNVNCGVPKTLVRAVVEWYAENSSAGLRKVLLDILATPVSPELLPSDGRDIAQKTEELIGPYELHDFFLFHTVRRGAPPEKLLFLARRVFKGRYADALIVKCLKLFISRFLGQQFKRSCSPDGVGTGSVSLSPRAGMRIPSDAFSSSWLEEL